MLINVKLKHLIKASLVIYTLDQLNVYVSFIRHFSQNFFFLLLKTFNYYHYCEECPIISISKFTFFLLLPDAKKTDAVVNSSQKLHYYQNECVQIDTSNNTWRRKTLGKQTNENRWMNEWIEWNVWNTDNEIIIKWTTSTQYITTVSDLKPLYRYNIYKQVQKRMHSSLTEGDKGSSC